MEITQLHPQFPVVSSVSRSSPFSVSVYPVLLPAVREIGVKFLVTRQPQSKNWLLQFVFEGIRTGLDLRTLVLVLGFSIFSASGRSQDTSHNSLNNSILNVLISRWQLKCKQEGNIFFLIWPQTTSAQQPDKLTTEIIYLFWGSDGSLVLYILIC